MAEEFQMNNNETVKKDATQEKLLSFDVPIESRRDLTETEKNLIGDIRAGMKKKYKLFCWPMVGQVALQANNDKYSEFINRYEIFRRRYIYRSVKRPECVILKKERSSFSILDLRKETLEKQKECVKNIAAAEARDVFNPEENSPLKIRVLVMAEDRIVVLMKVYMHLDLPITPFDIRRLIFFNMRMDSEADFSINEEQIENANQEVVNRCHSYFKNLLKIVNKPVVIPFMNNNSEKKSIFYTIRRGLEKDLLRSLIQYMDEKNCTIEQIFMHEYGQLFSESSATKTPLFAIKMVGSFMQLMPCVVNVDLAVKDSYDDIHNQMVNYANHSQCNFDEAMTIAGINVSEYFDVTFEFINENDAENRVADILKSINCGGVSEVSPKLEIAISHSMTDIVISYSYDSSMLSDYMVDAIHDSFIKALWERINSREQFSWKKYIEDSKSREEQIAKLTIAQKSLYIKEADFLKSDDPEDFIRLSTKGTYGNYVVEDVVYEPNELLNNLGILVSGHIEERQMDYDGVLKTVSLYKAGYILGLESILGINKCPFEYVAASDAKVLWLDSSDLKSIMQKYPSSYEALMKKAILEIQRLKKLWVLN